MRYNCGHDGCDLCGGRSCAGIRLKTYGKFILCEYCLPKAIRYAMTAAQTFGGTIINLAKECAQGQEKP